MIPVVVIENDPSAMIAGLGRARRALDGLVYAALARTVELASAYAKQSPLYRSHTYTLRSSIRGFVIGGFGGVMGAGGGPMGRVEATAPYAHFVEAGTAPHIILPRRRTVLRFVQNGAVRFARGVFHPGTEPRPFMADAAERVTPIFERLMAEAVTRAFA